jgi:hypothetical protein
MLKWPPRDGADSWVPAIEAVIGSGSAAAQGAPVNFLFFPASEATATRWRPIR